MNAYSKKFKTRKGLLILRAKDATEQDVTLRAGYSISIPEGTGTNREFQYVPPGVNEIQALVNNKSQKIKVEAKESDAVLINNRIQEMLAVAEAGNGVKPYFDFDHQDGQASAWPLKAWWGGEDPKKGGIRVQVELSGPGARALNEKAYQAFSPEVLITKEGDIRQIRGVDLNMGGMVNRPAFKTIERLLARQAPGANQPGGDGPQGGNSNPPSQPPPGAKGQMNKELMKLLAKFGILSSSDLDDAAAVAELSAKGVDIKEALSLKAKLATDYVAKSEYDKVSADLGKLRKKNAETLVAKAAAEGRIAPKNDALKAKWIARIEANPDDAELLEAMEPTKVPGQVVKKGGPEGNDVAGTDHELVVKAKAIAKEEDISEDEALVKAAEAHPKLYDDYLESLGKAAPAQS